MSNLPSSFRENCTAKRRPHLAADDRNDAEAQIAAATITAAGIIADRPLAPLAADATTTAAEAAAAAMTPVDVDSEQLVGSSHLSSNEGAKLAGLLATSRWTGSAPAASAGALPIPGREAMSPLRVGPEP